TSPDFSTLEPCCGVGGVPDDSRPRTTTAGNGASGIRPAGTTATARLGSRLPCWIEAAAPNAGGGSPAVAGGPPASPVRLSHAANARMQPIATDSLHHSTADTRRRRRRHTATITRLIVD